MLNNKSLVRNNNKFLCLKAVWPPKLSIKLLLSWPPPFIVCFQMWEHLFNQSLHTRVLYVCSHTQIQVRYPVVHRPSRITIISFEHISCVWQEDLRIRRQLVFLECELDKNIWLSICISASLSLQSLFLSQSLFEKIFEFICVFCTVGTVFIFYINCIVKAFCTANLCFYVSCANNNQQEKTQKLF